MNILRDVICDLGVSRAVGAAAVPDLDTLSDRAIERCREEAQWATLYVADCMDLLTLFDEHEPDPADVAERLSPADMGNWRAVIQKAAEIGTEAALVADVERDLQTLKGAFLEILEGAHSIVGIFATCPVATLPHVSESAWTTGTLFRWSEPIGAYLRISLPARVEIWIRVAEHP